MERKFECNVCAEERDCKSSLKVHRTKFHNDDLVKLGFARFVVIALNLSANFNLRGNIFSSYGQKDILHPGIKLLNSDNECQIHDKEYIKGFVMTLKLKNYKKLSDRKTIWRGSAYLLLYLL